MHLATPAMTSLRSYTGGGARSLIDQIDDSKLMQEMAGNFMKGESRKAVESPQNYGFTSVVMDATKDGTGNISASAEGFISFMGSNRSLPICSVMDDRRHRLKGLEKGDVAMFRTKDDGQQFHMTGDGGFWSAQTDKTVRMQLVDKQQQQQQGSGSGSGSARDASGGSNGSSGSGGQGQGQDQGQSPVYKNGQKSYRFVDVTQNATRLSGNESHLMLSDGDSYVHCTNQKTYLGGNAGKHQFGLVQTDQGTSINVYARVGGKAAEGEPDLVVMDAPVVGRSAALPVAMLLLGISLGVNYALATDAWSVAMSACHMIASR